MNVNLSPESFIPFAQRKLAAHGEPIRPHTYNSEINSAYYVYRDNLRSSSQDKVPDTDEDSIVWSLGTIASNEGVNGSQRTLTTLALLNGEAFMSMPNRDASDLKKAGHMWIESRRVYEGQSGIRTLASAGVSAAIWTDGNLHELYTIAHRSWVLMPKDVSPEEEFLYDLGVESLYKSGREIDDFRLGTGTHTTFRTNRVLDFDQQQGIRAYLDKVFPTT